MKPSRDGAIASLLGLVVGSLGGVLLWWLGLGSSPVSPLLGGVCGMLFGLLVRHRAMGPGTGLTWGVGLSFLFWVAFPAGIVPVLRRRMPSMGMLDAARSHFPQLIACVLCFGVPLGLSLGLWAAALVKPGLSSIHLGRKIFGGGLAGVLAGSILERWMDQVGFLPQMARMVGSRANIVGSLLYIVVASL